MPRSQTTDLHARDTVTIYTDPVTQEQPEGQARLVKRISADADGSEYWMVDFNDGYGPLPRTIYPPLTA